MIFNLKKNKISNRPTTGSFHSSSISTGRIGPHPNDLVHFQDAAHNFLLTKTKLKSDTCTSRPSSSQSEETSTASKGKQWRRSTPWMIPPCFSKLPPISVTIPVSQHSSFSFHFFFFFNNNFKLIFNIYLSGVHSDASAKAFLHRFPLPVIIK